MGWGISWYINGLLIPEIHVVRGKTYTFVTEGGHNPDIPAKYHPFYITDDPVGGYEHKTPEEKKVDDEIVLCIKFILNSSYLFILKSFRTSKYLLEFIDHELVK